jgi:hypothetical protein
VSTYIVGSWGVGGAVLRLSADHISQTIAV